jgi:hypothetical protein
MWTSLFRYPAYHIVLMPCTLTTEAKKRNVEIHIVNNKIVAITTYLFSLP